MVAVKRSPHLQARKRRDTVAEPPVPPSARSAHGRLMLRMLGALAEFERDLIRARTGEGRQRAKACGVRLGRKPKGEAIRRRDMDTVRALPSRPQLQRQPQHAFDTHGMTMSECPLSAPRRRSYPMSP